MNGTDLPVELPRSIAEALDRGTTILTANQRAARTLGYAVDRRNLQLGLKPWQPPKVMAWDTWTAHLWRNLIIEGVTADVLLNRSQEHSVWRSIIASDSSMRTLRSPDSLAELAADAWQQLVQYEGQCRLQGSWGNIETSTFQRWAAEFERRCRVDRLLSLASLEPTLRHYVETGYMSLPYGIALVGFDDLTPCQRLLVNALVSKGVSVEKIAISTEPLRRALVCVEDEYNEIAIAARWARATLEQHPDSRIVVIVPSLENRRASINRSFRELLSPEMEDIAAPNNAAPYEFSLGTALADTPMVRVAFDLLRWAAAPLPIARVSSLLVSPLFAMEASERNARAAFAAFELRKAKLLRPEVSPGWLTEAILRSKRRPEITHLLAVLRKMNRTSENLTATGERRSHSEWADTLREFLRIAEWGRSSGEDSLEFQTRRKWESLLDEVSTLDFDGTRVTYLQVLGAVERIAKSTTFAPESRHAPIQIMGPLEAAGSTFDAVWFMGAADLTWPAKPPSNPLLPWYLQRELGMPGTNDAEDDRRARQMADRIACSAPVAIFSYAAESSEGRQRPSPALITLQLEHVPSEQIAPPPPEKTVRPLEEFGDSEPVPITVDRVMQGGADILKLQAACAFRAFAERRLAAAAMREVELGMDAGERGTIVHQALEHFWNEVRTQEDLKKMTTEQRHAALDRAVAYGLRHTSAEASGWDRAYVDMQRTRLWNLLDSWLECELNRDPFSVRLSEKNFDDHRIGPLRLSVRVDRVDMTDDGDVIIDYKTGPAKSSDWQSDRPDAPQLPLYAVLATSSQPEAKLSDVAFAQIRTGKDMVFDGFRQKITAEDKKTRPRSQSLDEQLDRWRQVLTVLADSFHKGNAQVDPKTYPETCTYCEQRILCRLNPAAFDEELDDETSYDSGNG